jgi:hypothetical protein
MDYWLKADGRLLKANNSGATRASAGPAGILGGWYFNTKEASIGVVSQQ